MSVNHYGEGFNPSPEQRELVAQAYGLIDPNDPAVLRAIIATLSKHSSHPITTCRIAEEVRDALAALRGKP